MTWDSKIAGLHWDDTNYFLYYRLGRFRGAKQRKRKLGSKAILSLAKARALAKLHLAEVALGRDPFDSSKSKGPVISDLQSQLCVEYYSQERFIQSGHAREVSRLYDRHIHETFGRLKPDEITAPLVKAWFQGLKDTPYQANRAKVALSKILSYAEELGHRPPRSNPCRVIPNFPEAKRTRFASPEEARRIFEILEKNVVTHYRGVAFLKALMFTGSRPSFLERAKWRHLRYAGDSAILRLGGKTGEEEVVLPRPVLQALERAHVDLNASIFGPFPNALWKRIRKEAGCPDLRARDFRRFFGTTGLEAGLTRDAIGEVLNHKKVQTTKIYSLLVGREKVKVAEAISDRIENMVSGLG